MNEQIILNWSDFHNVYDVTYNGKKLRGVYCWGFIIKNAFVPYYIGIADNIMSRIYDHVNSIIGGRYTIFHKDSLHEFAKYKFQDADIESKGKLFSPDWPYGYKTFLLKKRELATHIDFMVDTFTFSYAVIDDKVDSYELKCIEKSCLVGIGVVNLINTRCGISNRFKIEHLGNDDIVEIFRKSLIN